MLAWGEDSRSGFRRRHGSLVDDDGTDEPVGRLNLGYDITDLSAGHNVLAFVKTNGNVSVIRTNVREDGRRVRGKQKFVNCKEKIHAVSCRDDAVTLLSQGGNVLFVDTTRSYIPQRVETLCNVAVCQVACGSQHSVVLTKDGQVYTWGQDSRGQLGLGLKKLGASSPQHLRSLSAIPLIQIAAGGEQSFGLSVSGGVFGWGGNDCGQLGLGDRTDRHTPTPVHCLNKKKTVQISCGGAHTVILTKDGAVFTFGSGQYGQLGHNSFSDELRPRLVAELLGTMVSEIACGQHHTLVLTRTKKIYSFGCDEHGQLGHGEESHPSVPLPVQLPQDADDDLKVRRIFAGYNCSFATCRSDKEADDESDSTSVTRSCLDTLIDKWTSECDSKSWKKTKQEIHRTFSSAWCMNQSFLDQRKDKHFQTSPKISGLKISLARCAFKKLVARDSVLAEVETALLHLLPSLDKNPIGLEGLRIFLLLNELLYVIQKYKQQQTSTKLAEAVAASVVSLSADHLQVIGNWWSSLSDSTMVKHVEVWKKTFSVILSMCPVPRSSGVRNLLLVLQFMYTANSWTSKPKRIPESKFCLVTDESFLLEELLLWRSWSKYKGTHAEPLILCRFPALLDLQSKKTVFDLNAFCIQIETFQWRIFMEHYVPVREDIWFVMDVRRALILQDTFEALANVDHRYFKNPLVVYFDKNYTLDDVNKKDFFYEVFHEMLSPESGMFMFNDSKTLAWFTSKAIQDDQRFFHFGILCGLAVYNNCIIHLPFPLALFKKLLGVKPSLEDMIEFSPCLGQSLQYILEDEDDDLKDQDMYFLISWDGKEVDLDSENPEKPVTSQNKIEFVDAYINHVFNTSVEDVFLEFKQGFFQICDQDLVNLFQPKELQDVLVGKEVCDWARLKQNTSYEGEYHVDHPTINMFWEVFDELSEDRKRAFLWFVTGFEREPISAKDRIKMTVRVEQVQDHRYDQYYPQTHTCSSILELPLYSTREIMHSRLTEALDTNRSINR